MIKSLSLILIASTLVASSQYTGSTTAAVVLAGGIIKSTTIENTKKYKRKDCPVCKGQGWYISGDKIKRVECGYCEPDNKRGNAPLEKEITHPPIILRGPSRCDGPNCKIR